MHFTMAMQTQPPWTPPPSGPCSPSPVGSPSPVTRPPPTEEQWLPLYAEDVHVQDPPFSVMRWLYKRSVA
jgi:hypothetical protein